MTIRMFSTEREFKMKKFEEKTLKTEKIYDGKIITLQVDDVELPNGKTGKREIVKHPGAVAVIALTKENKIILVEQYRKALEKSIVEIPAGKIDKGEAPEATALRELEEETGYTTSKLEYVQSFATSPGFADEIIHLYFAKDIEKVESPLEMDEDEFVELLHVSIEEMGELVKIGAIYDAKTAFAYIWLKDYLGN